MRRAAQVFAVALAAYAPAARPADAPRSSCVACHTGLDAELGARWSADVHAAAGLGCEACHGGDPAPALADDPAAAKAESAGFRLAPGRLDIPSFCGRCHADAAYMKRFDPQARVDQLAEYKTSVHGRRHAEGDTRVAVCTDCHGVHGILPVSSPKSPVFATNVPATCGRCHADAATMRAYGRTTDPLAEYRGSVHAAALLERGDTAAPACNDCHGNHGAAPPGVDSVAFVCGQCHGRESALFRASIKRPLFDALGQAECTVCHDHHRIVHPTPELFYGGSAPTLSQGTATALDPFAATLGDLVAGTELSVEWTVVLRPHLAPADPRFEQRIEIEAADQEPLPLDLTVRPGDRPDREPPRQARAGALAARATLEPLGGSPVQAGDALRVRLRLAATGRDASALELRSVTGAGVQALPGSVCLRCHAPGDPCDQATEQMYGTLVALERSLRDAAAVLHAAEIKGMEVRAAQFELKSKGTTTAVESRALIHAFDPARLVGRTAEGMQVAAVARGAGQAALAELLYRRKGLAVSLVLVLLVLIGLGLKIRELNRSRSDTAPAGVDAP